ncbi:hypothetical protein OTB20_41095 [Streptomyces sp. H27-H1]|uniref:putative adhesin n=1 Tax=Streptomyces sp. H27-H1 TaxID=2996461 RepID=UPI00226D5F4D|nr:hypothetical protein [Streptomyces sp. H27-H1]MCY0932433.1 hypothetical protein [Streptomyces sp. H27-H1]
MQLTWQNYIRYAKELALPSSLDELARNPFAVAAFVDYLNYTCRLNYDVSRLDFQSLSEDEMKETIQQAVGMIDGSENWDPDVVASNIEILVAQFIADTLQARNDTTVLEGLCSLLAAEIAFVAGHGTLDESHSPVSVPEGMTLHFLSDAGENLSTSISLLALAQGEKAKSKQAYASGDSVPNYLLSPEIDDFDTAVIVQANVQDLPLYFVGQDPLQSGATMLCTSPIECAALKTRHECDGVLGQLGHVKNLYFLSCRGIHGRKNRVTKRAPGEKLPMTYVKSNLGVIATFLSSGSAFAKKLDSLPDEKKAILLGNPTAKDKLIVHCANRLVEEKGDIAYYVMYLSSVDADKKRFDGSGFLRKSKKAAIEYISKFIQSDDSDRNALLENLEPEAWKFLAERVPGFNTWKSLGPHWDSLMEGNAKTIQRIYASGGKAECIVSDDGTVLIYDTNLIDQDPNLASHFSNHFKDSLTLVMRMRTDDNKVRATVNRTAKADAVQALEKQLKRAIPNYSKVYLGPTPDDS